MKAKLQSQNYASGPRSRLSKHRRLVAGLNNNLSVNWTGVPRFLRVIGALAQLYVRIKATLPQSGENFIRWLSESRATAKRESSASTWAMWSTDTNQRLRDGMGRCIVPRTPNVKSELVEGTRVSTEFPNSAASFGHQPELTPTNPIGHWPGVHYGAGGIKIGFPFVRGIAFGGSGGVAPGSCLAHVSSFECDLVGFPSVYAGSPSPTPLHQN